MGKLANRNENGCCRCHAGQGALALASAGEKEKEGGWQEVAGCRGRGDRACEKYLQIPTYRRWGRRLSLEEGHSHKAPN